MILNCTKKTKDRFHIKYANEFENQYDKMKTESVIEKEKEDELLNWGLKYFSFNKRKCIQLVNFKTKFNLYFFDININDLDFLGSMIACYLLELYKEDKTVIELLKKLFEESPICVFSKLENKSIISTLNSNEEYFSLNGYRFYDYIDEDGLKAFKINKDANWHYLVSIDKGKRYIYPAEEFKKALIERFGLWK